jgi:hypothetical protein
MRTERIAFPALLAVVLALPGLAQVARSGEVMQDVGAVKNCIGLFQAGSASISLTQGQAYEVTVDGNARANPWEDSEFDGVLVFYYDGSEPDHPVTAFLPKGGAPYQFVASDVPFYAFLVDKGLKDVPDNSGIMNLEFSDSRGGRQTLTVDAVFNCLGLEDFGAIKNVDVPPDSVCTLSIASSDAVTNGTPDGAYEGVFVFTRDRNRPVHPVILELETGDEFEFEMHGTSWVYLFLVDESYGDVGNNHGTVTVRMDYRTLTAVESATWTSVKLRWAATFR